MSGLAAMAPIQARTRSLGVGQGNVRAAQASCERVLAMLDAPRKYERSIAAGASGTSLRPFLEAVDELESARDFLDERREMRGVDDALARTNSLLASAGPHCEREFKVRLVPPELRALLASPGRHPEGETTVRLVPAECVRQPSAVPSPPAAPYRKRSEVKTREGGLRQQRRTPAPSRCRGATRRTTAAAAPTWRPRCQARMRCRPWRRSPRPLTGRGGARGYHPCTCPAGRAPSLRRSSLLTWPPSRAPTSNPVQWMQSRRSPITPEVGARSHASNARTPHAQELQRAARRVDRGDQARAFGETPSAHWQAECCLQSSSSPPRCSACATKRPPRAPSLRLPTMRSPPRCDSHALRPRGSWRRVRRRPHCPVAWRILTCCP